MQTAVRIDPRAIHADTLQQGEPPAATAQEPALPRLRVGGLFVMSGFAFGVLVGEAFLGAAFPAALVGMMAGLVVELLSARS